MKLVCTVYCPKRPVPWMRDSSLLAGRLNTKRGRGEDRKRTKYSGAKDRLSCVSFASMVQAAHLMNGNDTTVRRSVCGSRLRGASRQG